jgi:Pyruvate dehydrogenase complex, dehydrogenase (E1) component
MSQDDDPVETREWLDALESVIEYEGVERAEYLLGKLSDRASRSGAPMPYAITTPFRNTIHHTDEAPNARRYVHGTPHTFAGCVGMRWSWYCVRT